MITAGMARERDPRPLQTPALSCVAPFLRRPFPAPALSCAAPFLQNFSARNRMSVVAGRWPSPPCGHGDGARNSCVASCQGPSGRRRNATGWVRTGRASDIRVCTRAFCRKAGNGGGQGRATGLRRPLGRPANDGARGLRRGDRPEAAANDGAREPAAALVGSGRPVGQMTPSSRPTVANASRHAWRSSRVCSLVTIVRIRALVQGDRRVDHGLGEDAQLEQPCAELPGLLRVADDDRRDGRLADAGVEARGPPARP